MRYFKTLIITLFIGSSLIAQNKSTYYIKINSNYEYSTQRNEKNKIKIASNKSSIDTILNRSSIEEFVRVFPEFDNGKNPIHYVVCENPNLEIELNQPQFKGTILLVEKLCEPMLTGDIPNDPIYNMGAQSYLDLINASEAWNIAKNYPKVNVAITDTHFDPTHEDLSFILAGGSNSGTDWHGSSVAGCFGAINNNGKGIASTGGYNTNLYVSTNWGNDMEVLRLAKLGYRVINCSWINNCSYSQSQKDIYDSIRNYYNTVVIFGAGNGTKHCGGGKVYPASYESCVSVTSVGYMARGTVDIYGVPVNWKDVHEYAIGDPNSAYQHNDAVDICAAGYALYNIFTEEPSKYGYTWGTSFSAPQVAGVAAMILAINPYLTANQVVEILKNTADASIYNIPENAPYIGLLGAGRLDAYAAVLAAKATLLPPSISGSATICSGATQTYTIANYLPNSFGIPIEWSVSCNPKSDISYTVSPDAQSLTLTYQHVFGIAPSSIIIDAWVVNYLAGYHLTKTVRVTMIKTVNISPNPSNTILNVEVSDANGIEVSAANNVEISGVNTSSKASYTVVLYDKNSQVVRTATTDGTIVQFDTSNLPNDLYHINVIDNSANQIITQQSVMIQH